MGSRDFHFQPASKVQARVNKTTMRIAISGPIERRLHQLRAAVDEVKSSKDEGLLDA